MEVDRALSQISEIHEHLAKAELYRGYRSIPVGLSGAMALLAAGLQPGFVPPAAGAEFAAYWIVVAAIAGSVAGGGIVYNYLFREGEAARRVTRVAVGQLVAPFMLAAVLTLLALLVDRMDIAFLPGLWACLDSLGSFASRPYLPKRSGLVGLYYFAAGCTLLAVSGSGTSLLPWGMGLTFGLGQILAGVVLHLGRERKDRG